MSIVKKINAINGVKRCRIDNVGMAGKYYLSVWVDLQFSGAMVKDAKFEFEGSCENRIIEEVERWMKHDKVIKL